MPETSPPPPPPAPPHPPPPPPPKKKRQAYPLGHPLHIVAWDCFNVPKRTEIASGQSVALLWHWLLLG